MRPLRIEVEGFSAYRAKETVDFTGVDFFSLSGPTGAGKSSLIDAMIFALFGRVPRLGGNAVAPAISAGGDRARVRLDFEVDGTAYTAARLAQRTGSGGASVKEARLQRGERVIADGADEVTRAVEELLRMRFDDFTRTVVLPQGEFARFLTATRAERQALLRNLLGLDVYTVVRELARARAAVATERAHAAVRSREALEVDSAEERAAGVVRRDALVTLAEHVPDREKELLTLERAVEDARSEEQRIVGSIARLEAIAAPPRLEELDALATAARARVVDAEERRAEAQEKLTRVETALSGLPSPDKLGIWSRARARRTEIEDRLAEIALPTAEESVIDAEAVLRGTLLADETARHALADARMDHAAHVLAATLHPGERCPVCAQTVMDVPKAKRLPVLDELEAAAVAADDAVAGARQEAEWARTALATAATRHAELVEQEGELLATLEGAPQSELLEDMTSEVGRLHGELEAARSAMGAMDAELKRVGVELEELADASRQVAKKLTTAQLAVADLDPPVPESDDVVVQWKEIMAWRGLMLEQLAIDRDRAATATQAASDAATSARLVLVDELGSHDIDPQEPYSAAVATALQAARALVTAQEQAATEALRLGEESAAATREAAVANTLSGHLKANGFEQWLMAGALTELVVGANDLLAQLSEGGYSLHSDDSGSFSIIDHRNADEMRSVATLSGGETFLVSLALALSLAETLAAKGGSGLDAIILDEGFGTLDDESLDTVASVLEELTGRGLMVGVITHVKELAARAPVRYEVTREPSGAQVEKLAS